MKVIIAGDRNCKDYNTVQKAIEQSEFEVTEVVSGAAKGIDSVGEKWGKMNNIPIKQFKAEWDNLSQKGAKIKARQNPWTKKMEKYNASAGFYRNKQMAEYADALIAVEPNGPTNGTQDMIRKAKEAGLQIYEYSKPDEEYEYRF